MANLEAVLSKQSVFQGLAPQFVQIITNCASEKSFAVGQYIFREGEEANFFYVIREGKVSLELLAPGNEPLIISTIERDDVLGWSWLFPPYRWQFSARALEPINAIMLDGRCLRAECDESHSLGYELMKRFSHVMQERLQATRLQLLDLYGTRS